MSQPNHIYHNLELNIVVTLFIIASILYKFVFSTPSNDASSLPPGPYSLPIVGYLPFLGHKLHKQFTNMARTYGPIFKFYVGSKLHIVINTPDLAKVVVRDQDEIFANHNLTVAASIITYGGQDIAWAQNNAHWRNLRKIFVQEVLNNKNLDACSPFRRDEFRWKTIKNVYGKIGTKVNISEICFMTEANVLTNMVWENSNASNKRELQTVVSKIVELLGKPNVSDFFPSLAWFDLQGVARDMKEQLKKIDRILEGVINERMLRIESNTKSLDGKKDFLQILLELKDLNLIQVKALLQDIMVAGTETTMKMIEWAMTEILNNSNVMKKVHEELEDIVGVNTIVEESHLLKLKYLDATIKETSRLHPVAPLLVPRSPSKTCNIGGYTILKGCNVFVNVWSIQRDPRYWDNPLEFNPDRFLKNHWDYSGNNLKYFPFGSGRRHCPGLPLGEKMLMYVLASLLHSFDWSLPKGEENDFLEKFDITLKKRNPLVAIPSQRLPDASLYM
ncbi:cytochrome P450 76C1-like [Bidens hawaiensis]|uniref:cytochrome P450 76C1-like n=1 Tax=Bidens hawaiensis TaxID=980011 RepID=UPI00404B605C